MKNHFLLFFIIILTQGCYESKKPTVQNNKIIVEKILAEKILSEKIFAPDFMTRVGDKLLISSSKSDTMLYIYSLPSLKYLNRTGIKGGGPGEFQAFPMFCESFNNSLYVWGYTPLLIKEFTINNHGELNLKGTLDLSTYQSFNNMYILNDSLFIYSLPDLLCVNKYDLKNNTDLDNIKLKKDDHEESYFYSNRGSIAANHSFLLYGYLYKKQIDIYNVNDFSLRKTIKGNYKFQKPVLGDFNTPVYYTKLVSCKQHFYALCHDDFNKTIVLEVYNYDGQLTKKITFDIPPQLFVIDEENNSMYGYNGKYEDYLLKYKI